MKLADYLHVVCGARSLEELWHAHVAQMAEFEFDRLIYGYTRYKTETSLGDPDDFVILSNHSPEYLNGFLHKGLYSSAPMLRWALENEGAGSWRLIQKMFEEGKLGPDSERVVEFNKKMNMKDAVMGLSANRARFACLTA